MKITNLIALAAVAALAGAANAQTVTNETGGVQLKDIPDIGPLFRTNPYLKRNQTVGTRLRVERTPRGETLQVEIVEQDSGAALRQIAAVLGVNIVIDPAIQFLPAKTCTLYLNDTKDDVFDYLSDYLVRNEAVEKWKSSAGTYFFAAKPAVTLNGLMEQLGELRLQNSDPLTSRFGVKSQADPQPNWQTREFNGHEFYFIPVPSNVKSPESGK